MLSNAYFLAKFRFDTAENEPAKSLQNFQFANSGKCCRTHPSPNQVLHLQLLHAEGDTNKPRLQVWARPAGEGVSGTWSALLKDDKSMPLPNPWRLGFTSYSGTSEGKTACGVQVTSFHVHSYELSAGAASKESDSEIP